ncbi:unnamed protein product [Phytophthora fragariaefolia]|uniref:Unnamed protein product n=1 Tax=Phytophthora fragariaefolia TaxID=1490495 RepID=A0A9W6XZM3_9STRA|nr:unnamed protein product [Phytophthora fragariaefolia]
MGTSHSTSHLHPAREPAALLDTGTGVIVRIPDPVSGASTYKHNQRYLTRPTTIVDDIQHGINMSCQQTHVASVKPGEGNQALKASIVYLKKAPRTLTPPQPSP